jgi:protein phosphatase
VRQQYFVGVLGDQVAVFRGLPQDLGPIDLSTLDHTTGVLVASLPPADRDSVRAGLVVDSREQATEKVAALRLAADCAAQASGTTPAVTPTVTAAPAASPAVTSSPGRLAGPGASPTPTSAAGTGAPVPPPSGVAATPGATPGVSATSLPGGGAPAACAGAR